MVALDGAAGLELLALELAELELAELELAELELAELELAGVSFNFAVEAAETWIVTASCASMSPITCCGGPPPGCWSWGRQRTWTCVVVLLDGGEPPEDEAA